MDVHTVHILTDARDGTFTVSLDEPRAAEIYAARTYKRLEVQCEDLDEVEIGIYGLTTFEVAVMDAETGELDGFRTIRVRSKSVRLYFPLTALLEVILEPAPTEKVKLLAKY